MWKACAKAEIFHYKARQLRPESSARSGFNCGSRLGMRCELRLWPRQNKFITISTAHLMAPLRGPAIQLPAISFPLNESLMIRPPFSKKKKMWTKREKMFCGKLETIADPFIDSFSELLNINNWIHPLASAASLIPQKCFVSAGPNFLIERDRSWGASRIYGGVIFKNLWAFMENCKHKNGSLWGCNRWRFHFYFWKDLNVVHWLWNQSEPLEFRLQNLPLTTNEN